jgi:hypothetical protein
MTINPDWVVPVATVLVAGFGWGYVLLIRRSFLRQEVERLRRERESVAAE